LPGLQLLGMDTGTPVAKFDIELSMQEHGERIGGALGYATALFDRASIERHVAQLQTLLQGMVADEQAAVARLPLLPAAEFDLLLSFNATEAEFPVGPCIHQLFEQQVRRTPEAPALVFEDTTLSYAELNTRANRLAHHLITLGVCPDSRVALCLPRSIGMVVAILATLKAGGAYVPLDTEHPIERLQSMLLDCQPKALLTQATGARPLSARADLPVVHLDSLEPPWARAPGTNPAVPTQRPHHLAYIIYTSGSTGAPKGVAIDQQGLVARIAGLTDQYGIEAHDRVLQFGTFAFDASVEELWCTLCCGATLVLRSDEWLAEASSFWRRCAHAAITVLDLPTRYWMQLSEQRSSIPSTVRLIIVGGEELPASHQKQWLRSNTLELLNTYGPTETIVVATCQAVGRDAAGIGRPAPNTSVHILDALGQPAPIGVVGEIHIAGAGLARGYLNRPDLTAERFVPDPFGPAGARMYRSGDLGRWRADGTVEFIGRNDHQVKIRGFRIELGEIEAALQACPGVREAVVLAHEDEPGNKRLVAYLTGSQLQPEALRAALARSLPEYMVPAAYVLLEALPLTPNGKLDRKALPAPEGSAFGVARFEPPQGEIETTLAALWCELLGLERVGRADHFFELGGHSLLAVQLASRVRTRLGVEVALAQLFAQPRLAGFAQAVA
ncbi:MAG TPA: amino acid adenylation domain-containing protein, partial [Burkholderiaceae bacterium]|nr:amino acid adenylation domain-containing protein [Burkholderiaceae bacterium]